MRLDDEVNASGRLRRRHRLLRRQQRHGDGAGCATGAIRWQARSFSRLPHRAGVLLRDAHRRLRSRLRVNTDGTVYAFGAAPGTFSGRARHVRLHGTCGLGAQGLRRHLRRQVPRPRRRDGRDAVVAGDARAVPRRSHGDGGPRLPVHVQVLRAEGLPLREERAQRHLRARRADGQARVELPGRAVLADRRRPGAGLPHRSCLDMPASLLCASAERVRPAPSEGSVSARFRLEHTERWGRQGRPRLRLSHAWQECSVPSGCIH